MVAAELDDGGYAVLEIMGSPDDIEVGDLLIGELRSHGGERLCNLTKRMNVDVYIQAYDATLENVRALIS